MSDEEGSVTITSYAAVVIDEGGLEQALALSRRSQRSYLLRSPVVDIEITDEWFVVRPKVPAVRWVGT